MLTPDFLEHCADGLIELYEALQLSILRDMARRVARMGWVSDASARQARVLQEAGGVFDDAMARIAETSGIRQEELRRLFIEAGAEALRYDDSVYRAVGLDPVPVNQSPALLRILNATLQKTGGIVNNLTLTTAIAGQTSFINALDLAHMQVASGAMSYTQAITGAIKGLADRGAWVYYPPKPGQTAGHRDRIDVAVRRAVVTGVNQSAAQLQLGRMDEMGCDLLEVTSHYGERPTHAEWSGQVYSRSGTHSRYPEFVSSTGYGSGDGLCGWNCRHNFYPFFEGYSTPNESAAQREARQNSTVTADGRTMSQYEASRVQRYNERQIRKWKRQEAAFPPGSTEHAEAKAKVREWQAAQRSFVQQTGFAREYSRERGGAQLSGARAGGIMGRTGGMMKEIANQSHVITDASINAVKRLNIAGWSEVQRGSLQKAMRALLSDTESAPLGYEGAAYYDANFTMLAKYTGLIPGRVSSSDFRTPHISLHNHPDGLTFSESDIERLVFNPNMLAMGVVGNNGASYALVRTAVFDAAGLIRHHNATLLKHPNRLQSAGQYVAFMEEFLGGAAKYVFDYYR